MMEEISHWSAMNSLKENRSPQSSWRSHSMEFLGSYVSKSSRRSDCVHCYPYRCAIKLESRYDFIGIAPLHPATHSIARHKHYHARIVVVAWILFKFIKLPASPDLMS
ncbi:uncharacterized protein LOC113301250 isoform X2 [Papaver somniferum]|uniref:uncharacterized protein LOC113301250 isoform X2 n=1 Tax=Papaver somniferum TaxID=3469 RepID=UPI000E7002FA|nr:uncharacterized protein LOC113301250 isoform X2 [Papaver somniferum]XP_026405794.1 uncharacterized protein LOC113301250 isoform X2 [Papaver somniferum]